jgi:oligoribonuclease NrnB/cAMP/cGMP phosphodiesterase (DHH superfamily)
MIKCKIMKSLVIYHSRDLDGWMSAAIVKKWHEDINDYPDNTGKGELEFLGWDYGDDIPDTSAYDEIFIIDVCIQDNKGSYAPMLEMVHSSNVTWIDHHLSAINAMITMLGTDGYDNLKGFRNTKFAACELTWKYFFPNDEMPEIVRMLGRYDCFGHKGTDEEMDILLFQYGARANLSNYEECYGILQMPAIFQDTFLVEILEQGNSIYKHLCTEAKQTYIKAFHVFFDKEVIDPEDNKSTVIKNGFKFLTVNQERFNPVNFGIDYHKDGYDGFACFWYEKGMWKWSLYNDNGEVDCSVICGQFGGGGHKGASGFVCDDKTLKTIIKQ